MLFIIILYRRIFTKEMQIKDFFSLLCIPTLVVPLQTGQLPKKAINLNWLLKNQNITKTKHVQ